MGAKHNSKRLLVAAITIAGLTGGAMAAQAATLATRATAPGAQDLSVTSPPVWPAIEPTCLTDCTLWLTADSSSITVKDVAKGDINGDVTVPILGFGVTKNAGDTPVIALAGAPTSTIKVPVGTTLTINFSQTSIGGGPIDLSFPSLQAGKVTHVANVYTVHADTVGTSVFQPGANNAAGMNKQGPVLAAMGLVGVLIVTPKDGGGVNCAACAYDASSPTSAYADEALVATTDLDYEFAKAYPANFDMSYFGQPKHADDTPRQVYHVINGKSFPDTDVIDARAGDKVLLRYVNAGGSDKTMGLLGLRQTLLARNASAYQEKQTLIAPLIGPGETADAEVVIPGDAIAGQKYSLMDQGRQMNHGTVSGYGGALTFLNVWTGTAPTISAAAYDPSTHTVTAMGTPSSSTNILTGFQTLVTLTAATPLETDWLAAEVFFPVLGQGALAPIIKILSPAPAIGRFVWVRVQQGGAYSAPTSVQVTAIAPTVSAVAYSAGTVTGTGVSDPGLTITGFQTVVNIGGQPLVTDWSNMVAVGSPAASVSISGSVAALLGDTVWVRVQDSNGTFSAAGSTVVAPLPPPPPPPVIVAPTVSGVGYSGLNITAAGNSDPTLTVTGYQTAVTNLATDAPTWSLTIPVGTPASSVSISEPATAVTGQWVWVRVQDSNSTWSVPANAQVA